MYNYVPTDVIDYINTGSEDSVKKVENGIKNAAQAISDLSKHFQGPNSGEGIDNSYHKYIESLEKELTTLQGVCKVINRLYDEANNNIKTTTTSI